MPDLTTNYLKKPVHEKKLNNKEKARGCGFVWWGLFWFGFGLK